MSFAFVGAEPRHEVRQEGGDWAVLFFVPPLEVGTSGDGTGATKTPSTAAGGSQGKSIRKRCQNTMDQFLDALALRQYRDDSAGPLETGGIVHVSGNRSFESLWGDLAIIGF